MKTPSTSVRILAPAVMAALAVLFSITACHLTREGREGAVFSFPSLAGALGGADSALIVLRDTNKVVLDTLFDGPVESGTRFQGLQAERYQGGLVVISIEATRGGVLIYQEDRRFDGDRQNLISTHLVLDPGASIAIQWPDATLYPGDTLPLPQAEVKPENLADRSILWASRNASVFAVTSTRLAAMAPGSAYLVASLRSDTSKKDSVLIRVASEAVQSVTVEPKALLLYVNGESGLLAAAVQPSSAVRRLAWRSSDTSVVRVDTAGKVRPGKAGMAYVSAAALSDSGMRDSALVNVKLDVPRLQAGPDTVIAIGGTVAFKPEAGQEYGSIAMFKWDLDGDGAYDDSATAIRSDLSRQYPAAGEYPVRFYVRDSEGNDTTAIRKVTAVNGRVVQFHFPANGAYVNKTPIEVAWSVDGVRQTASETLAEGPNTISRTAKDAAGNTYSATLIVHLDTQPPVVKISGPEAGSLTRQGSVPVAWTVDGAAQTSRNTESLVGKQGKILIVREALDAAGNRGTDTVAITRDTVAPAAVAFVSPTSPAVVNAAHTQAVQWAWTRTGGAADSFLVSLNGAAPVRQGGTSYVLANAGNQGYTLQVQAVDAAGNVSEAVSRTVQVDKVAPPAPVVAGVTPTGTPTWTWTAGSGSDGARMYRYRLAPATAYSEEGPASSFAPTGLASGAYTLFVQERDAAGNWSTEGSHTLVVDRAGPTLTISSPSEMGRVANFNPQVAGTAEDANGVRRVEYRLNATGYLPATRSGESWNFTASYNIGVNVVWVRGEDNFGNRDSVRVNIYKYPNVIFVRKGATGNGRSWEDAYGELYSLLDISKSYPAGTEIWVTEGNYFPDPNPQIELGRLYINSSNFSLRGGFYKDRASVDTSARDMALGTTVLNSVLQIGNDNTENDLNFVTVDGFTLGADRNGRFGLLTRISCNDLTIKSLKANGLRNEDDVVSIRGRNTILENCEFTNNSVSQATLLNLDGFTTLKNCRVVNNRSSGGGIVGGTSIIVDGGYYENNYLDAEAMFHFGVSQMTNFLIIKNAAIQGGLGSIWGASEFSSKIEYDPNNRDF